MNLKELEEELEVQRELLTDILQKGIWICRMTRFSL